MKLNPLLNNKLKISFDEYLIRYILQQTFIEKKLKGQK